jgi:hypothetical protein
MDLKSSFAMLNLPCLNPKPIQDLTTQSDGLNPGSFTRDSLLEIYLARFLISLSTFHPELSTHQPLTAPAVKPLIKYFCKNKIRIAIGAAMLTAPAAEMLQ